jgi:outer membrane receptor protein involved in Fe transport
VYVNGVRTNEAFGDTVNWDLLPESIIDTVDLVGGSSPLFGLNALGGALSLRTKNGFTNPGFVGEASGGSFNRVVATAEAGGNNGEFGYFVNAQHLNEDGWRGHSPTDALNLFGSADWHTQSSTLDLQYFRADTDLTGNGPAPVQLLDESRRAVFTTPDTTKNHLQMAIVDGMHTLNDAVQLSGNAYYRDMHVDSFNGDGSPFTPCDDGAGNRGLVVESAFVDTNGNDACGAGEFNPSNLLRDQNGNVIGNQYDAINNIGDRDQHTYGGTLQATFRNPLPGRENQLIAGTAYDDGRVQYRSMVEVAVLQPNRSTDRSGIFAVDQASAINADTRTWSAYVTDTLSIAPGMTLTLSGRYDNTKIQLRNAGAFIDANGNGIDDLEGNHDYSRFNPAVGLTYQFTPILNVYAGYNEASRTPTPVELACASATAPCWLPNTFVADPPLHQVVAKTYEAGLRGHLEDVQWNFGGFQTTNSNDIIFQATGGISGNQGFFANVGDTRRSGVEVAASGTWRALSWFANGSFVRAIFLDPFISSSPAHPDAVDLNGDGQAREVEVKSGDRIPGIPEYSVRAGADYRLTPALSIGADVVFNSGQTARRRSQSAQSDQSVRRRQCARRLRIHGSRGRVRHDSEPVRYPLRNVRVAR